MSGQAQVAQKSKMIYVNTVEIHGKLCFSGQGEKNSIRHIQPVKAITVKFLVWENTTRKQLHPHELQAGNYKSCL